MTTNKIGRRKIDDRRLFLILSLAALPLWGVLLLFTHSVPPQSFLAILLFFLFLGAALFSTLTPPIYVLTQRLTTNRAYQLRLSQAIRQAGLIDAWVLFNLLFRLLHSWNIFTAIISFAIIIVLELLALGQKQSVPPRAGTSDSN